MREEIKTTHFSYLQTCGAHFSFLQSPFLPEAPGNMEFPSPKDGTGDPPGSPLAAISRRSSANSGTMTDTTWRMQRYYTHRNMLIN